MRVCEREWLRVQLAVSLLWSFSLSLLKCSNMFHMFHVHFSLCKGCVKLKVEFLLKTGTRYPKDAEVILFHLANPVASLDLFLYLSFSLS